MLKWLTLSLLVHLCQYWMTEDCIRKKFITQSKSNEKWEKESEVQDIIFLWVAISSLESTCFPKRTVPPRKTAGLFQRAGAHHTTRSRKQLFNNSEGEMMKRPEKPRAGHSLLRLLSLTTYRQSCVLRTGPVFMPDASSNICWLWKNRVQFKRIVFPCSLAHVFQRNRKCNHRLTHVLYGLQ